MMKMTLQAIRGQYEEHRITKIIVNSTPIMVAHFSASPWAWWQQTNYIFS